MKTPTSVFEGIALTVREWYKSLWSFGSNSRGCQQWREGGCSQRSANDPLRHHGVPCGRHKRDEAINTSLGIVKGWYQAHTKAEDRMGKEQEVILKNRVTDGEACTASVERITSFL